MPSPFPGMGPYIEGRDIWPDFHGDLASEFRARLSPRLRPRYFAALMPRVLYPDIEGGVLHSAWPDVGVLHEPAAVDYAVAPPITPAPAESEFPLDEPLFLRTVEIRTASDKTLVTSIEILSRVNKQPGSDAYAGYDRKRRAILASNVHLMEIDLLRAGQRPPLLDPVPEAPYYVTLSRVSRRPRVEVWPLQLSEALPVLPVPLLHPDPDAPLDLGAAVAAIYERGAYDMRIDYRKPPPLPPLSPADDAWVDDRLRPLRQ